MILQRTVTVVSLLVLASMPHAAAFEAMVQGSVPQGTTLEIRVPAQGLSGVRGRVGDGAVDFYMLEKPIDDFEGISRGAFVQLIDTMAPLPEVETFAPVSFEDISGEEPFAKAVLKAKALGYIHGYEDGLFHPYDTLTRAQAAKILLQVFAPQPVLEQTPLFTDLDPRHSLSSYLYLAIRAKLFQGYGDGTVKPDRALLYHEAEILLQRLLPSVALPRRAEQSYFRAFVGFHRINDVGSRVLTLTATQSDGTEIVQDYPLEITKNTYRVDRFTLPPSKTALFGNDAYNTTWKMIDEAKASTSPVSLWEGDFIAPAEGEISLGFGDVLYINGSYAGSHFGIDYANHTGTPVLASNSGMIVLADYTPSYGNTVIIDHGQNVFTMYMHMESIQGEKGASIQKGDVVGTIGATGIATGPHLHFTHFIGDVIVTSDQWFRGDFK